MITFDKKGLGKALGGWKHKGKRAAEYESADSNYRTYKPTVTPQAGGLYISTKIDHIRGGGGDDHAILELTFDSAGEIVNSSSNIKIGDKSFNTDIITASAALAGTNRRVKAQVAIAAKISKLLTDQIAKWNEHGGRANFPAVIKHNINLIAEHVRK